MHGTGDRVGPLSKDSHSVWWRRSIVFLTLGVAFFLLSRAATDPDLFGHILFGREILEEGLPEVDRYAFTSGDHRWINHEVLAEVAFAFVYDSIGNRGLLLFKLAIAFAMVLVLFRHLLRSGLEPLRAGVLLIPITMLLVPGTVTVRPQIFTYLFLLCLLLILDAAERGRPRAIWLAPPVLMVWINFHGGVLAGLALLAVWAAGRWLEWILPSPTPRAERLRAALVGVAVVLASTGALLVNPYGWELPEFLFRTATVPRPDISEWQATPMSSGRGIIYLVLVSASLLALHWSEARKRPPLLLVFAALVVLPLTAVRHIPLFALGIGVLLPTHFASVSQLVGGQRDSRSRSGSGGLRAGMIALTFGIGLTMIAAALPALRCIQIDPGRAIPYPVRAVEWIRQSGVEGNLATFFDWGEYAIWHLRPGILVSMDGRRETVYPDSIYREYLHFQNAWEGWDDHIDKRGAEMALVPRGWPFYSLMQLKPGWRMMYQDSLAAVFAPEDSPQAARLEATPIPDVPERGIGLCAP